MHDAEPVIHGKGRTVILLHGRGGSAQDMLSFAKDVLPGSRYVALQADDNIWYPMRFTEPRRHNQRHLDSALAAIDRHVSDPEDTVIIGFSQGACLAAEYAAKNPRRYAGIAVLSGGLIGESTEEPTGPLEGTPVIISGSRDDPFIPLARMEETARKLTEAGADVQTIHYPGNTHTIRPEEIDAVSALITGS